MIGFNHFAWYGYDISNHGQNCTMSVGKTLAQSDIFSP